MGNQVLQVRDWEPKFKPENQRTSLAKVWIKFPGISLEYWTEDNLLAMAKAFGKPIQVDNNTPSMEYGFFTSVLVEIDFAKKISDRVWVGDDEDDSEKGFWQLIEIPKAPKFCTHCKIVGHLVSECRSIKEDLINVTEDTNVLTENIKKKKRRNNKSKETPVIEWEEDIEKDVDKLVENVMEGASTTSTDPSIPPGFETHNMV